MSPEAYKLETLWLFIFEIKIEASSLEFFRPTNAHFKLLHF